MLVYFDKKFKVVMYTANSKNYYYEVDILRGIACLLVVFAHLPFWRIFPCKELDCFAGNNGVYLFFVISGFIISKTF
jgi:peptidoglycan/LPS O-acetylase OafA/YrhL